MPNLHSVFASILLLASLPAWAGVELGVGAGAHGEAVALLAAEPGQGSNESLDPTDTPSGPMHSIGLALPPTTTHAAASLAISQLIDRPQAAYQPRAPPR